MSKLARLICAFIIISLLALPVVGCAKPLTVSITSPTHGSTKTSEKLEVKGYVSDSKATVWVNDTIVAVSKATKGRGFFLTEVILAEGENTINVVAARGEEGKWKEVVGGTVTVTYTPKA